LNYRDGFKIGFVVGLGLTLLATGLVETTTDSLMYRNLANVILLCSIIPVQLIGLHEGFFKTRSSLFGRAREGFLNGMSCIEAIVVLIIFVLRL